ncbi:hypothetical protein [Streptomyces sp. NPDC014733]|uniref:hypothetical protein n=1 Tax=Streptomyces sp. NPDC014733 TaxID=3364885 RepID=UPI0037006544
MDTGRPHDDTDAGDAHGGGPGGGPGRTGGPGDGGTDAVALLRERLRRADEAIEAPPGLWARVRETPPERRTAPRALRRRRPYATAFVVAAAVAAVAPGVWWAVRPGAAPPRPAAPPTVPVAVYNTEPVCRGSHTLECALRLAKDPYRRYADRDNAAGRVWHGDVLAARCVVTDGVMVRDEQGLTSTRWYRVRAARGVEGWLPGVRTRNTREVPVCTAQESKL